MKKMNAMVFCQNNEHGKMEFFLRVNNEYNLYLFTTNYYSKEIYALYHTGRRVEDAYSKTAVFRQQKLNERILRMVKYMSEENGIDLTVSRKRQRSERKIKVVEDYDYEVA